MGYAITRKKGVALFGFGDGGGGEDVGFGEEGDHPLLGAFTLEAFGLALAPLRRQLCPFDDSRLYFVAMIFAW